MSFDATTMDADASFSLNYLELLDAYEDIPPKDDYQVYGLDGKSRPLSIQLLHKDSSAPEHPPKPIEIKAMCASDCSGYVATLHLDQDIAIVSMWYLNSAGTDGDESFKLVDEASVCLSLKTLQKYPNLGLAISRFGSHVVIFYAPLDDDLDAPWTDYPGPTSVQEAGFFDRWRFRLPGSRTRHKTQLRSSLGFGRFTWISDTELYMEINGNSLTLYGYRSEWYICHNIPLCVPSTSPPTWRAIKSSIKSFRDRYFVWLGDSRAMSIWDLHPEDMRIVSIIATKDLPIQDSYHPGINTYIRDSGDCIVRFSNNGKVLAIARGHQIRKYLISSGTEVGSVDTHILGPNCAVVDLVWSLDGMTLWIHFRDSSNLCEYLISLQVESSTWGQKRYLCSGPLVSARFINGRAFAIHGSTLDISHFYSLQEENTPGAITATICSEACEQQLDLTSTEMECSTDNGPRFRIEVVESQNIAELIMAAPGGENMVCLRFPIWRTSQQTNQDVSSYRELPLYAFFLSCGTRLVLISKTFVMLWGLPSHQGGHCNLVAMKKIFVTTVARAGVCAHNRWLNLDPGDGKDPLSTDLTSLDYVNYVDIPGCVDLFSSLISLYNDPASLGQPFANWQRAIISYVGRHLNACCVDDDSSNAFVKSLCEKWEQEGFDQFFKDLFLGANHAIRWVPAAEFPVRHDIAILFDNVLKNIRDFLLRRPHLHNDSNPIFYALEIIRDHQHRHPTMHTTLILHCIRNARRFGDTYFIWPVLESMQLMAKVDQHLALEVTRRMAYIPCKDQSAYRTFVIDNSEIYGDSRHLGAFFQRWFQRDSPKSRSLLCSGSKPVFQLTRPHEPDPETKYFKEKIFVISSGVLRTRNNGRRVLPLEAYDNPAIEGLLEHEWDIRVYACALTGRYEPVQAEMDGDNVAFFIIMTLYYIFSAIVMLNVLIDFVRLYCQYQVFYAATDEEVKAYYRKYFPDEAVDILERDQLMATDRNLTDKEESEVDVKEIQKELAEMKSMIQQLLVARS
ncbi:hypothetical protein BGZ50_008595 [Haplosporangium sp. Z 11]|nr:hypothetical protein BGZ50_008595 [Haplosporangium sp. Z 11]